MYDSEERAVNASSDSTMPSRSWLADRETLIPIAVLILGGSILRMLLGPMGPPIAAAVAGGVAATTWRDGTARSAGQYVLDIAFGAAACASLVWAIESRRWGWAIAVALLALSIGALRQYRRLLASNVEVPRLRVTPHGFAIDFAGLFPRFIGLSHDVRWDRIEEIRVRRSESSPDAALQLYFRFLAPGKPWDATISEAWPGFAGVCAAMERTLALAPADWLTQATALAPAGGDMRIYRRP